MSTEKSGIELLRRVLYSISSKSDIVLLELLGGDGDGDLVVVVADDDDNDDDDETKTMPVRFPEMLEAISTLVERGHAFKESWDELISANIGTECGMRRFGGVHASCRSRTNPNSCCKR